VAPSFSPAAMLQIAIRVIVPGELPLPND